VINGIAWAENGAALVTFGHDEKLRVWDLITGRNSLVRPTSEVSTFDSSDALINQTNFDPVIRNRRQRNLNPVLTPLRQSDPQIVFIPSESEIVGFNIKEGNVTLKQKINRRKVNALVRRPNQPELYYASTGGEINALGSFIAADDDEQEGVAEETKTNVLDTIYRSLVQNPITFS
jgi:DNA excision repair protein ERCC-8